MRKLTLFFLLVLTTVLCLDNFVYAEGIDVTAPSAVLMEASSGRVLYDKNKDEIRPCASLTKIMTLLLVMEAVDDGSLSLDEMVSASEHAASMGGSDIWLTPGENMSVNDLIKAVAVVSANDAAVALAERVGGTEENFVNMMNKKAQDLEMKNTVFKNCNGLDEEGHVTSANDIGIMSRELMKHTKIFDYTTIWMDTLRDGKTQLVNTNKLLKSYNGTTGLKTGTTTLAGCCISATAKKNDMHLIAVVLGCENTNNRFQDAKTLLDYGFGNFCFYTPSLESIEPTYTEVQGGMQNTLRLFYDIPETGIVIAKNEKNSISAEPVINENLTAPIKKGDRVGIVNFTINGETVCQSDILADEDIEEISFPAMLKTVFSRFLGVKADCQ